MHDCPECDAACYCDQDDTYLGIGGADCRHQCKEDWEIEDEPEEDCNCPECAPAPGGESSATTKGEDR